MAQLKDLIVNGASRFIGKIFGTTAQLTTLEAPTTSGGSTYGPGTSGQVLTSNGTSMYWGTNGQGGTVQSARVQATSPVVSSQNTAQTVTLNTTISLADNYGDTKNPYASKTAKYVLAAPNASAGTPSFRQLQASDISGLASASTATPIMDGTATPGSATTYAKGDHVHPVDTSRAAASSLTSHTSNATIHITASERTTWNGKQAALTFDTIPTENSTNPVQSKGIKSIVDDASFEKQLLTSSDNLNSITKSGVYYWTDSTPTNAPGTYAWLLVISRPDNHGYTTQICRRGAESIADKIYERHKNPEGTDWSDWTVIGIPGYASDPAANGTATPGVSIYWAHGDHVHPTDTTRAPTDHSSTLTTYGVGNNSKYGHVKLSDSTSSTSGQTGGIAATPAAVKAAYDLANGKIAHGATQYSVTLTASSWSGTTYTYSNTSLKCGGGSVAPIIYPTSNVSEYSKITSAVATAGTGITFSVPSGTTISSNISIIVIDFN